VIWDGKSYSIRTTEVEVSYEIVDSITYAKADKAPGETTPSTEHKVSYAFKGRQTMSRPPSEASTMTLSLVYVVPGEDEETYRVLLSRAELNAAGFLTDARQIDLQPCTKGE